MKIPSEVIKWLKENAYAVKERHYKNDDVYFISDFPADKVPDKLIIPINKRTWREIQGTKLRQEFPAKE